MAQHTLSVPNGSRTSVRTGLQSAVQAVGNLQKGSTAPSGAQPGWLWLQDTVPSVSVWTLWFYDGAQWISLGTIDTTNNAFAPSIAATTRLFQIATDTPGFGNTLTGGSIEKNAQGAALFLSRSSTAPLWLNVNANDNVATLLRSGIAVGSISVTTTGAAYNTTSDERAKDRIEKLLGARARIRRANIIRHGFIAHPKGKLVDGVLAHEFAAVVPHAVTGKRGAVWSRGPLEGKPKLQQVDYSKGVPLLFAGVQEIDADVVDLRKVMRAQQREMRRQQQTIDKLARLVGRLVK